MHQAARILIVEDAETCNVLGAALEQSGHQVECVATAADAHAALDRNRFDLALINILRREDHGRDLAYRAVSNGLAVLLISGHREAAEREWGSEFPFIVTSFDITQFRQQIELALRFLPAPERIARQGWHRGYQLS